VPYNARPTIRRKILGRKLTRAREAIGLTVEAVAEKANTTPSSIYRQESGHTAVKPTQVPFYTSLYEITDPVEIDRWTEWARRAKERGPWAASGSTVGPSYQDYADAESLSEELRTWELSLIPGLLQTPRYSAAVIRAGSLVHPGQQPDYPVDELLELRESRKAILSRKDGAPAVWAVIGEAAVKMTPGSPDAHRDQIQHLLNLGETKVTIQVLPLASGPHAGLSGSFSIITFDDVDMVFREGFGDGSFIDDEDQVRSYRARYERLQSQALSIESSRRYLHEALADI
jgi:transcriptional regulator with XRE-family HTH domain